MTCGSSRISEWSGSCLPQATAGSKTLSTTSNESIFSTVPGTNRTRDQVQEARGASLMLRWGGRKRLNSLERRARQRRNIGIGTIGTLRE